MRSIVFVCHGNICRSPMAEFVFKKMLSERGIEGVRVESRATSDEEIWNGVGNPIYPPAAKTLRAHGVPFDGDKRAQLLTARDCYEFDLVVVMDDNNRRNLIWTYPEMVAKVTKLLDFAGGGDVADPWYTGDFETAYRDIERGCKAILDSIGALPRWR